MELKEVGVPGWFSAIEFPGWYFAVGYNGH